MRKIIGIGETILDIIFKEEQPYRAVPGGSVFNCLTSLGRLGMEVAFISEVGNDRVGQLICDFMVENHISTDFVDRFPDGKSPISLAFLNERQEASYVFYKDYPAERLEVALPPIEKDDIFIYGSYYALDPVLRPRVLEFLRYAKERKAILYYDPNFRKAHAHDAIRLMPTVLENLELADIVRGSDEDFLNLFGQGDSRRAYEEHIRFYCDRFIVTRGASGVDLFSGDRMAHFDTPAIHPVSTIGAGDNFNAGVLYGLLRGDVRRDDLPRLSAGDWERMIRHGIDLATEVCQSYDNYISPDFARRYAAGGM